MQPRRSPAHALVQNGSPCRQRVAEMNIAGQCHCGNIAFVYVVADETNGIPARSCQCSFCRKHGNVWTGHPAGALRITIANRARVTRYAFGTNTADFHVCAVCGVTPLVTSRIDGRDYAVVNVNTFESIDPSMLRHSPVSFEDETTADRLTRRARHWIPDVVFEQPAG